MLRIPLVRRSFRSTADFASQLIDIRCLLLLVVLTSTSTSSPLGLVVNAFSPSINKIARAATRSFAASPVAAHGSGLNSCSTTAFRRSSSSKSSTLLNVASIEDSITATASGNMGVDRIEQAFTACKQRGEAAFITFVTAGYPRPEDTTSVLLAMQEGGASIIELGVPYTDPQADGATIQKTNQVAIKAGTCTVQHCLDMVKDARAKGLTVPIILMGYFNPFLQYNKEVSGGGDGSLDSLCREASAAGVDGFIVVDLPPDEGMELQRACIQHGLSNVPLVAPTSSDQRIKALADRASTFLYCVSVTGVTGARSALPDDLLDFITRVRSHTELPLAVGFGISDPTMVQSVANLADGVVVGSAILKALDPDSEEKHSESSSPEELAKLVRETVAHLATGLKQDPSAVRNQATKMGQTLPEDEPCMVEERDNRKKAKNFGTTSFGGQYIPETLSVAFEEIEEQYNIIKNDPDFLEELAIYRRDFVGGPTPLHRADRLTEMAGGATIWLKREDLAHTGAHKINNAIGQALLAKRLGKPRIIAETGAGQHGVATATICAKLGLDCTVYMGAVDCERQKLNVFRMNTLGAKVVPVTDGQATLKDAINEAMRDWVTNVRSTHYLIGSAVGPHPFPTIVRDFQSVIGKEIKEQFLEKVGKLPDAVVACVGGGSNAIGSFYPFMNDEGVGLYGVEAAGYGLDQDGQHCGTLSKGTPGVLQGAYTYVIQQPESGQTLKTHSISAGLDYPGVGPEHAFLKDTGRAIYTAVTDDEALEGFKLMCSYEGIIPALETSHAIYYAVKHLAKELGPGKDLVINMSGRGDKDMPQVARIMGVEV